MTNEELKKKIINLLDEATGSWYEDEDGMFAEGYSAEEGDNRFKAHVADALIAAGIGDVSEYKEKLKLHRVFVRKDGGDIKVLYGNNEVDEIVKERNEYKHRAEVAEHELERRLAEATKAMYVYERALYYATLNGETADEVKYNDALKRAQKDFAENKGD